MRIILLLVIIQFSLFTITYSQKSKSHAVSASEKKQVIKDVFLCRCVIAAFPADSLGAKDPSTFSLLENINAAYEIIPFLDSISNSIVYKASVVNTKQHAESTKKPRLMAACLKEYHSESLDKLIGKFVVEYMSGH
jgi:ubiquitin